jgi:hypothetical protein
MPKKQEVITADKIAEILGAEKGKRCAFIDTDEIGRALGAGTRVLEVVDSEKFFEAIGAEPVEFKDLSPRMQRVVLAGR